MYQLTLTKDERQAIDWIGERYSHGYDLYNLLNDVDVGWGFNEEDENPWYDSDKIVFNVPEYIAWEVRDLLDNSLFECFSPELAAKLQQFCDKIV